MELVYTKSKYKIYSTDDGYLLHNTQMEGFAHSHIKNLSACKWLIELSLKQKLPNNVPKYLLTSLLRVNDDEKYCLRIQNLLDKQKKQTYRNRSR